MPRQVASRIAILRFRAGGVTKPKERARCRPIPGLHQVKDKAMPPPLAQAAGVAGSQSAAESYSRQGHLCSERTIPSPRGTKPHVMASRTRSRIDGSMPWRSQAA